MNNTSYNKLFGGSKVPDSGIDLSLSRTDFDSFLKTTINPSLKTKGQEMLGNEQSNSLYKLISENLAAKRSEGFNSENINGTFSLYNKWQAMQTKNAAFNSKGDKLWEDFKQREFVKGSITEQQVLYNSDLLGYSEYLKTNKSIITGTIIPGLKIGPDIAGKKPLGTAGDITINELVSKGLEAFDTPIVKMVTENVGITGLGGFVSGMIIYKTIVNMYIKSAYNTNLTDVIKNTPSTRSKEIALFMIMGAPFVAGCMLVTKTVLGVKLNVKLIGNNETVLEGTSSDSNTGTEGSSLVRSSFFLFLNRLPSWLKSILNYTALWFIGLFIVKVIGYNSNIITEISSQFNVYLLYILKTYCILNFLVFIYFIWKLYVIVMYANNKDYINPEVYPKFIKNELLESKTIAIQEYIKEPGAVYKHYFFLISLYGSIVFFGIIVIVLYSISIGPQI
jgi:hypothetical protein